MRLTILVLSFLAASSVKSQEMVWQGNKSFLDSLVNMYRAQSNCFLTGSTLRHENKKKRLDKKLIDFLNHFYRGKFDATTIETTLKTKFGQRPWRFDEIKNIDSFVVCKGRIRSFGNLEPLITYVTLNNELIGANITIRIRSKLDCLQKFDGGIPDLFYLSDLITRIDFPFETHGWTEYFNSKIWVKNDVSVQISNQIKKVIGNNSTLFSLLK